MREVYCRRHINKLSLSRCEKIQQKEVVGKSGM